MNEPADPKPDSAAGAPGAPSPLDTAVPLAPVSDAARIEAVDTLRGFALLGILVVNVYAFAMPFAAYVNPPVYGGFTGRDFATWVTTHLLVDMKFMTIFSMLFGAGLVLMADRAESRGARFARIYYRRVLWLMVIGALHAYLLWFGDILFSYGLCGLALYPLRRLRPKTLIVVGSLLLVVGMAIGFGFGLLMGFVRDEAAAAAEQIDAGGTPDPMGEVLREAWAEVQRDYSPSPEAIERDLAIHRDGWAGIAVHRAPQVLEMQTIMMLVFGIWRIGGVMLLGMALMRLGVFSARRSSGFYLGLAAVGYGVGLPVVGYGAWRNVGEDFEMIRAFTIGNQFNYAASVAVAMGHVAVVMLVCRAGRLAGLRRRLAAVGRTALTNYLLHTLSLTTVFYGYGLGLYGRFGRFELMGFVAAVWALQLALSPWWLRRFRFGPAEWVWRSLTYGRLVPLAR